MEEKKRKKFERKMCEIIVKENYLSITEAKVLTYYANTFYVLLLDKQVPMGIVEFFVFKDIDICLHDYHSLERGTTVRLMLSLDKTEKILDSLWKEFIGE